MNKKQHGTISLFLFIPLLILLGIISTFLTVYLLQRGGKAENRIAEDKARKQFGEVLPTKAVQKKEKKLLFVRDGNIYLKNLETGSESKLTQTQDCYEAVLSSDLSYLAYQRIVVSPGKITSSSSEILDQVRNRSSYGLDRDVYLTRIETNDTKKVTPEAKYYYNLQFSPNAKYFAYFSWNGQEINIIDTVTGEKVFSQEIYGGRFPELSYRFADDNTIIIASTEGGSTQMDGSTQSAGIAVWKLDLSIKQLSRYGRVAPFADFPNLELSLSPEAKNLAYYGKPKTAEDTKTESWSIFIAEGTGANAKEIITGITPAKMSIDTVFSFSPDNKYLAFFQTNNPEMIDPVLEIYDIGSGKLQEIKGAGFSKLLVWDSENNLYFEESEKIKKVNLQTGGIEDFMDKASEVYFSR